MPEEKKPKHRKPGKPDQKKSNDGGKHEKNDDKNRKPEK